MKAVDSGGALATSPEPSVIAIPAPNTTGVTGVGQIADHETVPWAAHAVGWQADDTGAA